MAWWQRKDEQSGDPLEQPGQVRPDSELFPPLTDAEFPVWLDAQQPRLYHFIDFRLPNEITGDFSAQSLTDIGDWLAHLYPDGQDPLRNPVDIDLLDGVMRYAGECFIRAIGGHWDITTRPGVFQGIPLVMLDNPDAAPIDPLGLARAGCVRPEPGLLRTVFDTQLESWNNLQATSVGPQAVSPADSAATEQSTATAPVATELGPDVYLRSEAWARTVPHRIAWLRDQVDFELDGTDASLLALQGYVRTHIPGLDAFPAHTHDDLAYAATAYIGTVMLERVGGGGWRVGLGEPNFGEHFDGTPVVVHRADRDSAYGTPFDAVYYVVSGTFPRPDPIMFFVTIFCDEVRGWQS